MKQETDANASKQETDPTAKPVALKAIVLPIYPIRDRILVLPDPDDEKIGMIHIPEDNANMKKFVGTVVAVGEGIATDQIGVLGVPIVVPLAVKVGDRIIYDKYAGSGVEWPPHSRIEYILIVEANVLAVVRT